MGCIKKLSSDILVDCANQANIGLLAGVSEILLINRSDVVSYAISTDGWAKSTIVMNQGAKAYILSVVKKSASAQIGIRQLDNAPAMEEHTVTFKELSGGDLARKIFLESKSSEFVVIANTAGPQDKPLFGGFCGLTCTDISVDSSGDGCATLTFKTPEGCAGDMLGSVTAAQYEALKKPKA